MSLTFLTDGQWVWKMVWLLEVQTEFAFASFRSGVSPRHPDGESQKVSETWL